MYCRHCGAIVSSEGKFCSSCGGPQNLQQQGEQLHMARQLIGYSEKIKDPRFIAITNKIHKSGILFTFVLAMVAVIGFTIAGAMEVGGFENPLAMYMGFGMGGLLLLIGVMQRAKTKSDRTWDGIIVDKQVREPSYSERREGHMQAQYILFVRKDDGKTKRIPCTQELLDYYQIGESVRHHGGTAIHIFEKYDKSRDSIIFCIACTSKNDINNKVCFRCKCPLLT